MRRKGHLGRIGIGAQNGPVLCWDWEVETRRKLDFLDLAAGSDHAGAEDVVGIRIPWLRAVDILLNQEQSPEPTGRSNRHASSGQSSRLSNPDSETRRC